MSLSRWAAGVMLSLALPVLAACGDRPAPPPGKPAQGSAAAPGKDKALMRSRTNVYLYDSASATEGGTENPRFEVRDVEVVLDQKGAWSFENALAIIYGSDGSQTELRAGRIEVDRNQNRAKLTGGVKMTMGARSVELQDFDWLGEERVAKSDNPVVLRDGENEIQAKRMRYDPDSKMLILEEFTAKLAYQRSEEQ
ncbi:MAG: LPS export ABC transporter periplasmic protein LptC [FCB group bacterium]|nr:LPS export ABC transporter periplasmic protein LptC [FCB group bacterium]